MHTSLFGSRSERLGRLALALVMACALSPAAAAAGGGQVVFPYYRGEDALHGLYAVLLPHKAKEFADSTDSLVRASQAHCNGPGAPAGVWGAWRASLLAWQRLSSPALGPVIERRSQRQIDFWPTRPALLAKALQASPQSLEGLQRIGTPAKGFGAMEQLLLAPPSRAHCPYLVLLAQEMQSEARALEAAFDELGRRDWNTDEAFARALFGEWINQWLGGLERLRWTHVEQPVQKARTSGSARAPAFARQSTEDNRLDWLAQWRALRELAVLPTDRDEAPKPGQDVVPIEALLMGRGHLELAQRWAQAVDAGDRAFAQLPAVPTDAELMALSQTLKRITVLYQTEVAAALDVPLGFSDADGD